MSYFKAVHNHSPRPQSKCFLICVTINLLFCQYANLSFGVCLIFSTALYLLAALYTNDIEQVASFNPKSIDKILSAPDIFPKFRMSKEMKEMLAQASK